MEIEFPLLMRKGQSTLARLETGRGRWASRPYRLGRIRKLEEELKLGQVDRFVAWLRHTFWRATAERTSERSNMAVHPLNLVSDLLVDYIFLRGKAILIEKDFWDWVTENFLDGVAKEDRDRITEDYRDWVTESFRPWVTEGKAAYPTDGFSLSWFHYRTLF